MGEQQEKMKREYEEEVAKKKAKEEAKLKRQEELLRRQTELQKEMQQKKKEAAERKFQERRNARETAKQISSVPQVEGLNFRTDSPPIPALRGQQQQRAQREETNIDEGGPRPGTRNMTRPGTTTTITRDSPDVLDQLTTMREGLERKKGEIEEQQEGAWQGLAEL